MANLVSPGYKRSRLMNDILMPYEERTLEFRGLNRKDFVEEGEMSDMLNLTSDKYPLLTARKLRGVCTLPEGVTEPYHIITKYDRSAMIAKKSNNSIAFFYGGTEVPAVAAKAALTSDTRMVAINTKICFFPQKTYVTLVREGSSVTVGSVGALDNSKEYTSPINVVENTTESRITVGSNHGFAAGDAIDINGTLTFTSSYIHTADGAKYRVCTQSDNTGGEIKVVCNDPTAVKFVGIQQEGSTDLWVIAASDSPFTLESYTIKGVRENQTEATLRSGHYVAVGHWYNPAPVPTIQCFTVLSTANRITTALNMMFDGTPVTASCDVRKASGTVLTLPPNTFLEIIGEGTTSITVQFTGTIKRESPDLKHIVEWNNRLWGVSDKDNTVYACKLGDPTNWKYYQSTTLDSYYAQQGTDGKWTGAAPYSGHLIFFKENSMTKIYGTSPSTFQVTNTVCFGVEDGSSKSVAIINDTVFYKSSIGIMAYDGGTPYSISGKLNSDFFNVVGGTDNQKYYASIENSDESHELLVLDVERALWHKEDNVRFRDCCTYGGRLYFISDEDAGVFDADAVYVINPYEEQPAETLADRKWMATFGPFDENIEDKKIFSKLSLRFIARTASIVTIYIKIEDGPWEKIREFNFPETGGETVPIVPRRCDRFSIKIEGTGECEIKSLTRRYRRGSVVKDGYTI